ncbi:MAG TPA: hypothetical protein VM782_01240 [Stellaceae bacterium]|nr:hypothetical protein [Stellaceae bacterium]
MSDPLYQNAQGIVNAAGTVILPFSSPGQGYAWTGTVNVPNAIGNEKWQVQVGNAGSGLPWGTFLGNSPFGPVQALDSAVISITGTGLTPGTIYTAVLIGSIDPKSSAPTAMPQPQPLTLAQIASTINAAVSGAVTANPPLNGTLATLSGANFDSGKIAVSNAGAIGIRVQNGVPNGVSNAIHEFLITWYASDQTSVLHTETWVMYAAGAGNGPFSTLVDVFPPLGPYFRIQEFSGNGGAVTCLVWATSLGSSFERSAPLGLVKVNGATITNGTAVSVFLGTGGQTLPANWSLGPDNYYQPGSVDIWALVGSGSALNVGACQIQEIVNLAGSTQIITEQITTNGQATLQTTPPWRATLTRNTPLFSLINNDSAPRSLWGAVTTVREG